MKLAPDDPKSVFLRSPIPRTSESISPSILQALMILLSSVNPAGLSMMHTAGSSFAYSLRSIREVRKGLVIIRSAS